MAIGQGTKCRRNINENKTTWVRCTTVADDRNRQTTDERAIVYSEREREFRFANKRLMNTNRPSAVPAIENTNGFEGYNGNIMWREIYSELAGLMPVVWCLYRRSSTTTVERWSRQCRSSLTPTPTSSPRWSRSCSTRCSSRATTSSARARSAPRCTSYRRASSTSSPRPAKWPPACRTAPTSEVGCLSLIVYACHRDETVRSGLLSKLDLSSYNVVVVVVAVCSASRLRCVTCGRISEA